MLSKNGIRHLQGVKGKISKKTEVAIRWTLLLKGEYRFISNHPQEQGGILFFRTLLQGNE